MVDYKNSFKFGVVRIFLFIKIKLYYVIFPNIGKYFGVLSDVSMLIIGCCHRPGGRWGEGKCDTSR